MPLGGHLSDLANICQKLPQVKAENKLWYKKGEKEQANVIFPYRAKHTRHYERTQHVICGH